MSIHTAAGFRRELLLAGRVTQCRSDRPGNFQKLLLESASRSPESDALICGSFRVAWRGLAKLVEETAAGLAGRGIGKGDRVALVIGNRAEFVIALFAILRLGAIAVPISVREQAPGIAYAINHSSARLLLFDPAFAAQLPGPGVTPSLSELITTDDPSAPWKSLRSSDPVPDAKVAETDIAVILYTSGTTGKPKGAMLAHVNLVHAALLYEEAMGLQTGERSVVAVPMTHVTGLTALIAAMARCAGALVILPEFKAQDFVELAASERMTHTVLVPAMYNLILTRVDLNAFDLSSWRIGAFGGAPMPAPIIQRLNEAVPSLGLMNLYGATETACAMAIMPPDQAFARREQVGRAAPGAEIVIMNAKGVECAPGESGEIWLRGATVSPGYWDDPHATELAFVEGFWRSGDVGVADDHGFISVLDRIKDMIIRGGFKIYTAEVESVLAEHAKVLESAVVSRPCPVLGERVHAFVAARPGADLIDEELRDFCDNRLADYKRPESYSISTDPLPRNANGKLLKREMRSALLELTSAT